MIDGLANESKIKVGRDQQRRPEKNGGRGTRHAWRRWTWRTSSTLRLDLVKIYTIKMEFCRRPKWCMW